MAGFEVFAPTIWKPATRARRNTVGAIIPARPAGVGPLFRTYFFARFRLIDYWRTRDGLPNVETILGLASHAPTPVPDRAMEFLRGMCDADGCFHEDGEVPNTLVGKMLRLLEGPFVGFEGICDWAEDGEARATITAFNRPCPVTVDQEMVEVV